MEHHTSDNMHAYFETGQWKIRKFVLPNASDYIRDINKILFSRTGLINAWDSNIFFAEASQMILNSIFLFQEGFFDAAFYSLRQAIEISIGSLYLTAKPEKMKEWNKLESGFESGKMVDFLQKQESAFKELRTKMSAYFENIRSVQKKTNKYVHKQGYSSFYTMLRAWSWSDHRADKIYHKILSDFEETLNVAIGAVAMYRLAIDPLPIILMDEELMRHSIGLITESYSETFIEKYIGKDNIELYKQTELYQGYKNSLMLQEKQNDAVFDIIHLQIIDRSKFEEISEQSHLLTFSDRLAVVIMMSSIKIPQVYIEGCLHYVSDIKATCSDIVIGSSYFEKIFANADNNFNVPFKDGSYISRIKICDKFSYVETNDLLDESEVNMLNYIAKIFEESYIKQEKEFMEWFETHKKNL